MSVERLEGEVANLSLTTKDALRQFEDRLAQVERSRAQNRVVNLPTATNLRSFQEQIDNLRAAVEVLKGLVEQLACGAD